jgi:ribosome-associated toxin RatA of RatAB toxin-antitoxin module
MSHYEHSITISRDPKRVFSFISDVGQMPRYFPLIRKIDQQGGGDERVQAEVEISGFRFSQAGFFKADQERQQIDFGSAGQETFRGWIRVTPGPDASASDLTVHLGFNISPEQEKQIRQQFANLDALIRDSLRTAAESVKNICEGRGDPLNEADAAAPA